MSATMCPTCMAREADPREYHDDACPVFQEQRAYEVGHAAGYAEGIEAAARWVGAMSPFSNTSPEAVAAHVRALLPLLPAAQPRGEPMATHCGQIVKVSATGVKHMCVRPQGHKGECDVTLPAQPRGEPPGRYACPQCAKEYPSVYAAECCPCFGDAQPRGEGARCERCGGTATVGIPGYWGSQPCPACQPAPVSQPGGDV